MRRKVIDKSILENQKYIDTDDQLDIINQLKSTNDGNFQMYLKVTNAMTFLMMLGLVIIWCVGLTTFFQFNIGFINLIVSFVIFNIKPTKLLVGINFALLFINGVSLSWVCALPIITFINYYYLFYHFNSDNSILSLSSKTYKYKDV